MFLLQESGLFSFLTDGVHCEWHAVASGDVESRERIGVRYIPLALEALGRGEFACTKRKVIAVFGRSECVHLGGFEHPRR